MKRREFLVGTAVGAATVCGLAGQAAQAPATGARQGGPGAPAGGGQAQGGAAEAAVRPRCRRRSWRASR